jgi:hypothetical protein
MEARTSLALAASFLIVRAHDAIMCDIGLDKFMPDAVAKTQEDVINAKDAVSNSQEAAVIAQQAHFQSMASMGHTSR